MTQTEHAHVVELHTGDCESAQELARKALKCSLEATRYSEKVAVVCDSLLLPKD